MKCSRCGKAIGTQYQIVYKDGKKIVKCRHCYNSTMGTGWVSWDDHRTDLGGDPYDVPPETWE